jgi:hypothetical protein
MWGPARQGCEMSLFLIAGWLVGWVLHRITGAQCLS